jgi:hypothetical protein
MSNTGRRQDSKDRRIIERVTSPHMISHMRQMRWIMLFLTIIMGAAGIYNISTVSKLTEMTFGLFLGIVFFTLATACWRYYSSMLLYLENESSSNLDRVMERQLLLWLTIAFFATVYGVVHLIFKN